MLRGTRQRSRSGGSSVGTLGPMRLVSPLPRSLRSQLPSDTLRLPQHASHEKAQSLQGGRLPLAQLNRIACSRQAQRPMCRLRPSVRVSPKLPGSPRFNESPADKASGLARVRNSQRPSCAFAPSSHSETIHSSSTRLASAERASNARTRECDRAFPNSFDFGELLISRFCVVPR